MLLTANTWMPIRPFRTRAPRKVPLEWPASFTNSIHIREDGNFETEVLQALLASHGPARDYFDFGGNEALCNVQKMKADESEIQEYQCNHCRSCQTARCRGIGGESIARANVM
jgi:hypothetical protein